MHVMKASIGRQWSRVRKLIWGAGLGAALLIGGAGPTLAHEEHGHPARIHAGSCEELGAVTYRLNGPGASVDLDNAPVATQAAVNPKTAYQVMATETTIEGTLDELLAGDHAVMIYESDEEMTAIACGNIGGAMVGDSLVTGLAEAGIPGHIGFAMFRPEGDQTLVTVILGHAMSPVSAAGAVDEHGEAAGDEAHEHEGEDAEHDEEHAEEGDHAATATPEG
jgi:hypothetical protein